MLEETGRKNNTKRGALLVFLGSFVTMLLIFGWMKVLYGQDRVLFPHDLYHQYVPFSKLFWDKVVEGSNIYYSFHVGMGGNTALLFAFYSMSPFNVFYLLIDNVEMATCVILVLKPVAASVFFYFYCRYNLSVKHVLSIPLSVAYGVCGFYFYIMMMNSLTEGLYFLPLVFIVIKYFYEKKKIVVLTLVYGIMFLAGFYSGYIVGLSSFGYFCILLWLDKENDTREKVKRILLYAIAVVIAVMLASFLLFPAAYYALFANQEASNENVFFMPWPWDIIDSLLPGRNYVLDQPFPYISCGLLPALLLPAYFLNPKISKRERGCAAGVLLLLCLGMMVKPLYHALHMFNMPNGYTNRFGYVCIFVILSIAMRQLKYMEDMKWKTALVFSLGYLLIYVLAPILDVMLNNAFCSEYSVKVWGILAVGFLLWVLFFYQMDKQVKNRISVLAYVLIFTEIVLSNYCILKNDMYYERTLYETEAQRAESAISSLKDKDEELYRVRYFNNAGYNQQALLNYYGISYFSSSVNGNLAYALEKLGYVRNDFRVSDLGQSKSMAMLLGVKYEVTSPWEDLTADCTVIQNEYVLPFGYMVSSQITDYESMENVFYNQQALLYYLTGKIDPIYEVYSGQVGMVLNNMSFEQTEEGMRFERMDKDLYESLVMFQIPYREGVQAYAYFVSDLNPNMGYSPLVRTVSMNEPSKLETAVLSSPRIVEMEQNGDYFVVYITIPTDCATEFILKDMQFAYCTNENLSSYYNALADNPFRVNVWEDGYVEGNVTVTGEKDILFLSIPYEEGWEAMIDGKKVDIVPLLEEAFIGLELSEGEHQVALKFIAPWSRIGRYLSITGVIFLVLIVLGEMAMKKRIENLETNEQHLD